MERPSVGDQEMAVLRYVVDHAPISVRDVAEQFGEPRGLARTTILTMMERLRKKGYLKRRKENGVFQYVPAVEKTTLLRNLVHDFVEKTLGGSLLPFVAYLAETKKIEDNEVAELKKLVQELESEPGEKDEH